MNGAFERGDRALLVAERAAGKPKRMGRLSQLGLGLKQTPMGLGRVAKTAEKKIGLAEAVEVTRLFRRLFDRRLQERDSRLHPALLQLLQAALDQVARGRRRRIGGRRHASKVPGNPTPASPQSAARRPSGDAQCPGGRKLDEQQARTTPRTCVQEATQDSSVQPCSDLKAQQRPMSSAVNRSSPVANSPA